MTVDVAVFGATTTPVLRIEGPGGAGQVALVRSPAREGLWQGQVPVTAAGLHVLALDPGDALGADDRLVVEVPGDQGRGVDWRLDVIPMPPDLRAGDAAAPLVAAWQG